MIVDVAAAAAAADAATGVLVIAVAAVIVVGEAVRSPAEDRPSMIMAGERQPSMMIEGAAVDDDGGEELAGAAIILVNVAMNVGSNSIKNTSYLNN